MTLPAGPSRDDIWGELTDSNYRNGGTNLNHLKDMYAYVFGGTGSGYSRDAFGGYGIPQIALSLTLSTGGSGEIDCDFTINDLGEPNSPTIEAFAEYYPSSEGGFPASTSYQSLGTFTSTGAKSGTITGLSNGTEYRVRVTLVNVFNNAENFPTYPSAGVTYDWSEWQLETPQNPALSTPSLSGQTVDYSGVDVYCEFAYSDSESGWRYEYVINSGSTPSGSGTSGTVDCDNTGNPAKIRGTNGAFPNPGDSVWIRVQAIGSGGSSDSQWSAWEEATENFSIPSCPV